MSYIILCLVLISLILSTYNPINLSTYNKETIEISVTGCVIEEKTLTLSMYSTIQDAIDNVSLNDSADCSSINSLLILKDKDRIVIPCRSEINKVSINSASKDQLLTLPGIGEALAGKIIEYRNSNGLFQSIEDIQKVNGIKESKYNQIKDYICL